MRLSRMASAAVILAVAMAGTGVVLRATTVMPPTFDELVTKAHIVFVGETLDVRSQWAPTSAGRPAIVTLVTFRVLRTLKGQVGSQTILDFLGGTVGEDRLDVAGMPRFRLGDRDVLFVDERGRPISPVVAFGYGRFRILQDPRTGRESISRHNFEPLSSVSELGADRPSIRVSSAHALSLAAFESEVVSAVRRLTGAR